MKLLSMKCENCGAQLDLDLDKLQAYCPYCGHKVILDFDQYGEVLSEKEKTKRSFNHELHKTKRAEMEYAYSEKKRKAESKGKILSSLSGVLPILFCLVFLMLMPHFFFSGEKKEHEQKIEELQILEDEIEDALSNCDFETAMFKANQLYCDDNWSDEETEAWNEKRTAYIEMIKNKKISFDSNDPNNIFMPASSSSFNGKPYSDVVEQFRNLGFTNISTQQTSKEVGLFDKNNTVEHILIGGKTEFSTDDYFNKDSSIVVYYYVK